MNEIHETCRKIKMSDEARARILAERHRPKHGIFFLLSVACLIGLVVFLLVKPQDHADDVISIDAPSTTVEESTTQEEDMIVFNSMDGQLSTALDVAWCGAEVTDPMFIDRLRQIGVPEDMSYQNAYGLYSGVTAPKDDNLFGYAAYYVDPNDENRNIELFFSETTQRKPDCFYNPVNEDEPSLIMATQVLFYQEGQDGEALFTKDGWHYDIQTYGLKEEEIVAMVRSVIAVDLEPVPPVLDAYADIEVEQRILLSEAEEKSGRELYDEADLVAMIHILTITGSRVEDGDVCTEGYFSVYHSYKGNNDRYINKYIRKGGIDGVTLTMRKGDFLLEQGECYLAFIKFIDDERVEIISYQDGCRKLEKYVPSFDRTKLSFYNSRTGEYEPIVRILPDLDDYGECFAY